MKLVAAAIALAAPLAHADVDAMAGVSSQRSNDHCGCVDTYGGAAELGATTPLFSHVGGGAALWLFDGGGAGVLAVRASLDRVWVRAGAGFGVADHFDGDGDDRTDASLLFALDAGVVLEHHGRFATTASVGVFYPTDDKVTPVIVAGLGVVFR